MIGGDSGNVVAVRPLRAGTMTEFDITQRMIEVVPPQGPRRFRRPRVLIACPRQLRGRTAGDRGGGARSPAPTVTLVEEPLAAAIGAGLRPRAGRQPRRRHRRRYVGDGGRLDGRCGGRARRAARRVRPGRRDPGAHPRSTESRSGRGRRRRSRSRSARRSPVPPATRPRHRPGAFDRQHGRGEDRRRRGPPRDVAAIGGIVEAARVFGGSPARAHPRCPGDGDVPHRRRLLLRGMDMLLAQECEVPSISPSDRWRPSRRRRPHAGAPGRLPVVVPAGPPPLSPAVSCWRSPGAS